MKAIDDPRGEYERRQQEFATRLTAFIKRWAPEESYERFDFERSTHELIQMTYTIAQEPLLERLMQIAKTPPFVIPAGNLPGAKT